MLHISIGPLFLHAALMQSFEPGGLLPQHRNTAAGNTWFPHFQALPANTR